MAFSSVSKHPSKLVSQDRTVRNSFSLEITLQGANKQVVHITNFPCVYFYRKIPFCNSEAAQKSRHNSDKLCQAHKQVFLKQFNLVRRVFVLLHQREKTILK